MQDQMGINYVFTCHLKCSFVYHDEPVQIYKDGSMSPLHSFPFQPMPTIAD